jgi:hypothetical protein
MGSPAKLMMPSMPSTEFSHGPIDPGSHVNHFSLEVFAARGG